MKVNNNTYVTYDKMISEIEHSVTQKYLPKENDISNKSDKNETHPKNDTIKIDTKKDPITEKSGKIIVEIYESAVQDSNPIKVTSNDYIFINGVFNDVTVAGGNLDELNKIVEDKGVKFELFHNPTHGVIDGGEASINLLDPQGGSTKIARKLAQRILDDFKENKAPVIAAHSQGAAITANALNYARAQLVEQGLSAAEISRRMATVKVLTMGGFEHQQNFPREISLTSLKNINDPIHKIADTKNMNIDDAILEAKYYIKNAPNTASNVFAKVVVGISVGATASVVTSYRANKTAGVSLYQGLKGINDFVNLPSLANGYGFISKERIDAIKEHSVVPGYLRNEYGKEQIRKWLP
jgi:hypothetical protein